MFTPKPEKQRQDAPQAKGPIKVTTIQVIEPTQYDILENMGGDWYSFESVHLGRGIMVSVKDITEHLDAKKASFEEIMEVIDDNESVNIPSHFTVLGVCKRFLLLSPFGDESKHVETSLSVPGPYCGTSKSQISRAGFPEASPCQAGMWKQLVEAAQMMTGKTTLLFAPGVYTLSTTMGSSEVEVLQGPGHDTSEDNIPCLSEMIPRDITIRMEGGETMEYNRSILVFYGLSDKYFPNFQDETVLIENPTLVERNKMEKWVGANGSTDIGMNADCVFLVGGSKEKLEVNRSVLAMSNDVLCRLVYGTEQLPADLGKQIPLPDFDAGAVKLVFQALMLRSNVPKPVPTGEEAKVLAFLDFIDENPETAGLDFALFSQGRKCVSWYRDEDDCDDNWILCADDEDAQGEEDSQPSMDVDSEEEEEEDDELEGFEPERKVVSKSLGVDSYLCFSEDEEETGTNEEKEEAMAATQNMEE